MTLFRLIKERIGDHPNIVSLREVYFDQPPFFVEEDYVAGQDLKAWCEAKAADKSRWRRNWKSSLRSPTPFKPRTMPV